MGGALAALLLLPAGALAVDTTYTLDGQFDLGVMNGVNHDAPNNNQLQLSTTGSTFPVMWIANAGEDTVSRIDTDIPSTAIPSGGCETARYRTSFGPTSHGAWSGPAPSRTAVDQDGNVYVANRHFDGRSAEVMRILAEGGIDRNHNGVIDTAIDLDGNCQIDSSEILPLTDDNHNGIVDPSEIQDERVAWIVRVGASNGLGRSLCIDRDGDIWLGLFNSREYYELSATDGSVLSGPISTNGLTPYGCLVDANGKLWSANLGSSLGELDTTTHTYVTNHSHAAFGSNYGIALGNGMVYLANRINRSYTQYNPVTGTFSTPAAANNTTLGVTVDGDGNILVGQNTIDKFASDGSLLWTASNPSVNGDARGLVPDQNNDIWVVNRASNNLTKFRGTDGTFLGTLPVGSNPYTYSDASGFAVRNTTTPSGFWKVTTDGGAADTVWGAISWNTEPQGSEPPGTVIKVEARAANTPGGLTGQTFVVVSNGAPLGGALSGRYLGIKVTLKPDTAGTSPVLSDLRVTSGGGPIVCDVDGDGDVDRNDIRQIYRARRTQVQAGDPRDFNGDGQITINDARGCVLECTNPRCR